MTEEWNVWSAEVYSVLGGAWEKQGQSLKGSLITLALQEAFRQGLTPQEAIQNLDVRGLVREVVSDGDS